MDAKDGTRWAYEISDRANHSQQIVQMLEVMRDSKARMVGFNNIGFDYSILHMLYQMKQATAAQLYDKAMAIIQGDSWTHTIWPNERIVEQLDLYKIHHFDNKARATSLKVLEFNKEYRRLVVSHSAVYRAQEKRNIKAVNKKAESAEKTTLGDISDLADLKKKMESGK